MSSFGAAVNSVQKPAPQASLEARFALAERHSRLVRILRVAVPAAVIVAMAAVILVSVFNPFRMLIPKLPINMENLVVSGTKITMESPHLSGYTTDRRPYELWAKTATQDITDPDHVELKTLRAKLLTEDQSTVMLDARSGVFDNKQQTMELQKDVFLQTSSGYQAKLNQAFIDMGKGIVTSDDHVDVTLTNGTISADRLRITGGGEVVRFEGNVVMHLDNLGTSDDTSSTTPPQQDAAASAKARSTPAKSTSSK
jgi:lipopolysaccharide export system protein LptC